MINSKEKKMIEDIVKMLNNKFKGKTITLEMDESGFDLITNEVIQESCGCCSFMENKTIISEVF